MVQSIGKMRHRFTIQEAISTSDSGGGNTVIWQNIANNPNVFVELISLRTVERANFSQVLHKATHKIMMRYRDDLTLDKRFTDGTDDFEIEVIEDIDANKRFLVCYIVKL